MDNVFNKQITLHDIMQTKIPPHDKKTANASSVLHLFNF